MHISHTTKKYKLFLRFKKKTWVEQKDKGVTLPHYLEMSVLLLSLKAA